MKILELRFKNLNSLYGEWCIDFTNPAYTANGIFALTGPTGSGKSTILDALSLALYGATPRLGKITKSTNEIMSRRTGECYAEVLFASQSGRFRCRFDQHRSRKKADGELQNPRHEIAEGGGESKIIENQLRRTAAVVEDRTGMDFERFTRSILLAQGGFDTFLKADAEQKSKILEQITGTEIYSEISRSVHERRRDEQEKLNLLQAEISGIAMLEPEEEKAIALELEERQKQETEVAAKADRTAKAVTWLTGINELKNELRRLTEAEVKLQAEIEAFKPEREQLARALKAATLEGSYATLTTIRKQQLEDREILTVKEKSLPEFKTDAEKLAAQLNSAVHHTGTAKHELKAATPLIKQVRSLDQQLNELRKIIAETEQNCEKAEKKIESDQKTRLKELEKRTEAEEELKFAADYLKKQARDEWLTGNLAGVEMQLDHLLSQEQEIARQEAEQVKAAATLEQITKKLNADSGKCAVHKQKLEEAVKKIRLEKAAFDALLGDRMLREYRTEKDALLREMALLTKIAELESHRGKLEDGKPCPLCGAREHPFARGNVPVPDEIEKKIEVLARLIDRAEALETSIRKLEKDEAAAREDLTKSEKRETAAINDKNAAARTLAELQTDLKNMRADFAECRQAVNAVLEPLGIAAPSDFRTSALLEQLKKRLAAWQFQCQKKADIEKQLAEINSELKRLDAVIETRRQALDDDQKQLKSLRNDCAAGYRKRRTLFGNLETDAEEIRLNWAVSEAEQAEKQTRARHDKARQKFNHAESDIAARKEQIAKRALELEKLESDFNNLLPAAGFADEHQFLIDRLAPAARDTLTATAEDLDRRQTELKTRQLDHGHRLTTETALNLTDSPLAELQPQLKIFQENLQEIRDEIAGLKHRLSENSAAKERLKEKQTAIDSQKKECRRWEKLHGLIGSADGKKFRNFAQGLTFELMVSHANRQLQKMSDRYLLIRDTEKPLELNVIDNYQAGEIRSTRNLSGGESFIVSLTLALGLSKMASRKVRVDSLFLDEGFGTLDEEALETALETLSNLQQDSKLIGIISHVPALKERISTQISVTPVSGGKSILTGPGCSRLKKPAEG